jgi:enamine deaminase RidA (YjgF/YER057c/UK114 family)
MTLWSGAPYEYSCSANGLVFTAGACPLNSNGNPGRTGRSRRPGAAHGREPARGARDAGVAPDSLLKTTVYVVPAERADLVRVWDVVSERLGRVPSTLLGVSCLGYPGQLVKIEAVAAAGI